MGSRAVEFPHVLPLPDCQRLPDMFDSVTPEMANFVGLTGVGVYLTSFALMQLGIIKGQSYVYASMVIIGASCVMFSLTTAFNMSSFVIQFSYIVLSIVGMTRLFLITRLVRFSPEERQFLDHQIPLLSAHLARKLLNMGTWQEYPAGLALTTEQAKVKDLVYLHSGRVSVDIGGHHVGHCDPGTYIGELTFLTGGPATATVTTTEPCRCLVFSMKQIAPLIKRNPEIRMALIASFSGDTKAKLLQRNRESLNGLPLAAE